MARELTPPAVVRPAEDLAALAAAINAAHEAGEGATRQGLGHFRRAGEALLKAKEQCGHGGWLPWLRANVCFGERRAQRYMRLAKYDVTSDLESQWRLISGNAPEEPGPPPGASEVLAHVTPELVEMVKTKEVTAALAAELAHLPLAQQEAVVFHGPEAVRAKAAELRAECREVAPAPRQPEPESEPESEHEDCPRPPHRSTEEKRALSSVSSSLGALITELEEAPAALARAMTERGRREAAEDVARLIRLLDQFHKELTREQEGT